MEKISVTIRVRPLSKVEAAKGSSWKLGPNSIALCNERGAPVSGQSFTFDRVFGSESTTLEIYEAHTKDIIASAVQGFNGTVFAYGQTSSGKTFTMRGSPQEPGIIPLAVQEVFRNIQETENREFLLRVSYMEIYNEEINDLLAPENRKLQVHENFERGIFVAGLREEIVVTPDQVLDLMTSGETYRHIGETNMNVYSSRSHTIFRMVIESRDRSQDDPAGPTTVQACDAVRVSVLNLVDLAGSERVAKTGAEGARLKEGTHINKSLMTLGTVINKLCEGVEKQGGHVPYRDSKLTRILQPALGGNAKTAVICNVTPALIHVDETKGTLFFASRANRVTNCAQVNEIMTDAALLKRQKSEIEELRSKLQENHSDHWEEKILQLRNALLKTELDKERMALELQEEKKAQVEKERRLKEQEQKIENLSTMVINSAVDDRDLDKRSKKNNRRETWCPRIPSAESDAEESKKPFSKESPRPPMGPSKLPTRRERLPPLPPPFESLMEEEDTVSPFMEADENARGAWQRSPSTGATSDSSDTFLEPAQVNVGERKRRLAETCMDIDLRQQLGDLQVQFDDLQFEHELKMQEKMLEMEELKKELDCAQTAVSKAQKLDDKHLQGPDMDRRGKSLDGWEADSVDKQLRAQGVYEVLQESDKLFNASAQVQNLELEKHYMQRELDNLKEQAKSHAAAANDNLVKLQHDLHVARKESSDAKLELSLILQQVEQVQKEKQWEMDLQTQLVASFSDLKCEIEATMCSSQALQVAAFESTHALSADLKNLQASVGEAKSLKAALQNQTFPHPQSELAAVMKEHNMLLMAIQTVQNERDAFCEISKEAQVNLRIFEEEIRSKSEEIEDAKKNLNCANSKLLNAGDKIAELQSLLLQREIEQQTMEQKLKEMEGEALASDTVAEREVLSEKIKKLKEALRETTEEKAILVQKGEVMHITIQVLEGERDALMETTKQAQADMDRLQGKRRQELKEARNKLELALSDNVVASEQLVAMRSLLSQRDEEHEITLKKSQILESESLSLKNTLEEMVQNLETERIMTKQARADQAALETNGEELLARLEVLVSEKQELSDSSEQLQAEIGRLCREIDTQGDYFAGVERKLESAKAQSAKDGKQLADLQALLERRNNELEVLKHKIVNLEAEKGAMETCLATHESPESISGALIEMSLRLSGVESSLQEKAAELEEAKKDFVLLQESNCKLQTDLTEAKTYTAAVEETLAEAVTALDASTQETLTLDLAKAHEDVALKITLLASLQQEHALLFESLTSVKAEMEEARARWEQHAQEHKTTYDVLIQEKVSLAEERNALRSALTSTEEERDALKEQNFQAQSELKEFDVEVQRQRQEIDAAERALEVANNDNFSARDVIVDLESLLSQKTEEVLIIQKKVSNVERESLSVREALESKLRQLESTESQLEAVMSECSSAQEQLVDMGMLLSERNDQIKVLNKDHAELEAELDGVREYTNNKVSEVEQYALDAAEERSLLVEKQEAMLAALQKLEEERDGFFMGSEVLKEKVNRLKELAGIQETQLANTKLDVERAERQVLELQLLVAEMTSEKEKVEKDKDILFETTTITEKALKEELETQKQAAVSNLEVANAEIGRVREKLLKLELLVSERTEEKDRLEKEKDVLRNSIMLLQDEIAGSRHELEVQQLELKEVESKLATASSEIDAAGKQLQEVHALMYGNHQEQSMLQQKLEEVELSKSASEKRLVEREAELSSLRKAASETTTKLESHYTESSQLKSDIMGLRKELKAAKAAPAALEKERDGLRKDIEKLKTKMGDVEAKLKSTLVEKSKIEIFQLRANIVEQNIFMGLLASRRKSETEKVNMDREVKHLRQSTVLLNKRESLVDKRRESVACGLNKTKLQLSSTEHALQMKTNELEKTAFDLQLLQDNYAKLEIEMSETEKASAAVKEKLSEVETAIAVLNEEKSRASHSTWKIAQELEATLEQNRVISAQLKGLQAEYDSLLPKLHGYEVASKALMVDSEKVARSIAMEKENFAQQLIDAHFEFEEEKAAWASQTDDHNAKCRELDQEIADLIEQRQQVEKAEAEGIVARDLLQGQVMSLKQLLHESAEECLHREKQLNANVEEHRKLLEKVVSDKQHHEALEADFRKLEELMIVSETTIREEREAKRKLVEETQQDNETIELLRGMCKSLEDQVVQLKETGEEANNARAKQYEELEALKVMAQVQGERCRMLEEKILATESSMQEESEAKYKLSQEVDRLQEKLQHSMEELARPPSGEQMRLLETVEAERCQIEDRALRLEAECNSEREAASVARKQVEKLQTQLNGVIGTTESLQAELDLTGMKNKNLSLEVDDTQAHLDKVVSVKNALRQQIKECNARISSLYESIEQINKERKQEYFAHLTLNTNLQTALDATRARQEILLHNLEEAKDAIIGLAADQATVTPNIDKARLEVGDLHVELDNLRNKCRTYEEELKQARRQLTTLEKDGEEAIHVAEVMHHNSTLQLLLQASREEMRKMHEVVRAKEEAMASLQVAIDRANGPPVKREQEVHTMGEPEPAQKPEYSTMELKTPMASGKKRGDPEDAMQAHWSHPGDTQLLYSSNWASKNKVEQLKLQSQSLLQKYKKPWRIQRSPGVSMDQFDAYNEPPPPSATLHSSQENLTAPIYPWKKAKIGGMSSDSDSSESLITPFSEVKPRVLSLTTRGNQRAALVPLTQNNNSSGLERRLHAFGSQAKVPENTAADVGSRPSLNSLPTPREYRVATEKENL